MRRHAKAPSAGSTMGAGTSRARKSLFGMVCLCAVTLVAFLGSGAPTASAVDGACPNQEFRTGPGALLPGCRAYEQVSPVHKNGEQVGVGNEMAGPVSPSGDAVGFVSKGIFADMAWGGIDINKYSSRREGGKWVTRTLLPTPFRYEGIFTYQPFALTPDLTKSVHIVSSGTWLTDDPASKATNWYRSGNLDGSIQRMASSNESAFTYSVGTSLDLSHVALHSIEILTEEPEQPEFTTKLYEFVDGQLRLVSREPVTGTPFPGDAVLGGPNLNSSIGAMLGNTVSEDGRHIFFTTGGPERIYRRTDGATTLLVSPSQRTVPDTPASHRFQGATPDGNRVFFTSDERLTDDAEPGDLYRYDIDGNELVSLSAGPGGSEAVSGVVAIDRLGDRVYFVAGDQLIPGQGESGAFNLYLWESDGSSDGAIRFIGKLDSTDGNNWNLSGIRTAESTDDGRFLLFRASSDLIPGHESGGLAQVYLYDAEADGGDGALTCISCDPSGVSGSPARAGLSLDEMGGRGRAMTADGRRVVFHTADALLARDTNEKFDAYLWEDGSVHLLSSGTDSDNSYAFGISVSGDDVFFRTGEVLVPGDVDTAMDIYTARVNGGLSSQHLLSAPPCAGEECRKGGTTAPVGPPAATSSFQGPPNAGPKRRRCGKGKRRIRTRDGKTRCVKKNRRGAGKRGSRR